MRRFLREPLFHFLLLGAALFLIYDLVANRDGGDTDEQIVVSAGRIQQLANVFRRTWQRPPTRDELQELIDDFVLEEAYYRKATAMGIDRDDTIIRRRLRQKLEFLTDDMSTMAEATDEQLAAYLETNKEKFLQSPSYTFEQIYFSPERHGPEPTDYVAERLEEARRGDDVEGDPSLLPQSFAKAGRQEVDGALGVRLFASAG